MEKKSGNRLTWGTLFGFGLIGALICFEVFNFKTSLHVLEWLMGPIAILFTVGCCLLDFFGLLRITPPNKNQQRRTDWNTEEKLLFSTWFVASGANAVLTFVAVYLSMQENTGLQIPELMYWVLPIIIAVLTWAMRIGLIVSMRVKGLSIFFQTGTQTSSYPVSQTQ